MLCFPVSLLTATALIEAIKRVVRRRLSPTKSNVPAESLNSIYDCPSEHAMPGVAPQVSFLERESSDIELGMLRSLRAVLEDIHHVLGLSTVNIVYFGRFFTP